MDGGWSGLIWKEDRNFGDLTQLVWWASAGLVGNSQLWWAHLVLVQLTSGLMSNSSHLVGGLV